MKRMFALVVLVAALGVILKVALKPSTGPSQAGGSSSGSNQSNGKAVSQQSEAQAVLARYSLAPERALVGRVLDKYGHTAVRIEATDGYRGLRLLDCLDLQAVFLYEKHPGDFRRLREAMGDDDAAADVLLRWREYFGSKWADSNDRSVLVNEITRLSSSTRRLAAKYPNALPLLLTEPEGVSNLIRDWQGSPTDLQDTLGLLLLVSLDQGSGDLRNALRILENHGPNALKAYRLRGIEGFALIGLYGQILRAIGDSLPMNDALVLLHVNSDYIDRLLRNRTPESIATSIRHIAATNLTKWVASSPYGLQLVVEHAERGEEALRQAGPDASVVAFESYADPELRNLAVECMATHGVPALVLLDKYSTSTDFREILRQHGAKIILPIAKTDTAPEALAYLKAKKDKGWAETFGQTALALSQDSGQDTIRRIKEEGLDRVGYLNKDSVKAQEFLPLYDVVHLGNVLLHGHSPTNGELTWALIDGSFVIADVLSLAALQPEGAAAVETARSQAKLIVKSTTKEATDSLSETAAKSAAKESSEKLGGRLAKWWAVRKSGGAFELMRRLPEATQKMSVSEICNVGRSLCSKAGVRLASWKPFELLKDGKRLLFAIPPEKGLKYIGAQAAQVSVGVLAFHKMEEHLRSRRLQSPSSESNLTSDDSKNSRQDLKLGNE